MEVQDSSLREVALSETREGFAERKIKTCSSGAFYGRESGLCKAVPAVATLVYPITIGTPCCAGFLRLRLMWGTIGPAILPYLEGSLPLSAFVMVKTSNATIAATPPARR